MSNPNQTYTPNPSQIGISNPFQAYNTYIPETNTPNPSQSQLLKQSCFLKEFNKYFNSENENDKYNDANNNKKADNQNKSTNNNDKLDNKDNTFFNFFMQAGKNYFNSFFNTNIEVNQERYNSGAYK